MLLFIGMVNLTSCETNVQEIFEDKNAKLYVLTDYFVESLYTTYESYGMSGLKHRQTTDDSLHIVFPVGRLINVKINDHNGTEEEYIILCDELKEYYKNNPKVNDVYICKAGTIMIDCRN